MRNQAPEFYLASLGIPEESMSLNVKVFGSGTAAAGLRFPELDYTSGSTILDPHGFSTFQPERVGQRERLMSAPTPNSLSRASSFTEGHRSRNNSEMNVFNMASLADALEKKLQKEDVLRGHEDAAHFQSPQSEPRALEESIDARFAKQENSMECPAASEGLFNFMQNMLQGLQHINRCCVSQKRPEAECVDVEKKISPGSRNIFTEDGSEFGA
eukprot:CAMPEP_0172824004 /NCGR_PEP_ID=MMETSP1075-20121228/17715_1 /TAXON_ID=2916 /ORGANISM="Ceratium fusus, Strain PA161109" /LENGTH=213 /DNA_ID=CAMNT_0013665225 /DNA_START=108 /DNA_END=749 /DNA_ORIENTATION=-